MRPNPKPQEIYRHFKGGLYQVLCLAQHSETGETMAVYQAMYAPFRIYARPLDMFMEEVDRGRYPEAEQRYRFELMRQEADGITPAVREQAQRGGKPDRLENPAPGREPVREQAPVRGKEDAAAAADAEEQVNIDPLVMDFLDADTYEQRLHILAALRDRVTDDMINTMAVAVDLEIKDGSVEERYEELKNCLLTFEKYECNRLR